MENNKLKIIAAANELAGEVGVVNLTRAAVCVKAGVPDGSFQGIMGQTFTEFVPTLGLTDNKPAVVTKKRISKDDRKDHLLRTALTVAKEVGYTNVTRALLAKEANVSEGLVSHYFGTMTQLKRGIMRAAITTGVLEVLAQGLSVKDKDAEKAPDSLKQLAAATLVS